MPIAIELLLMLLAAVGVTISVGALEAMSFEERTALSDSLLNQIQTGTRQDEFIQDLITANEDFEAQKKEAIVTNLDGTKTQVKPITLELPDRTFQNLKKYAIGINRGLYSLSAETLQNVTNYTDIVNYFLSNNLVDSSVLGEFNTKVQEFYNAHTSAKMSCITCVRAVLNSRKTNRTYREFYFLVSSDNPIVVDTDAMFNANSAEYIIFKPLEKNTKYLYNSTRTYIGSTANFDTYIKGRPITVVTSSYFTTTDTYSINKGDILKIYVALSYRDSWYNLTEQLIRASKIINKVTAKSGTKDNSYDIAGVGSIAKNPNRVLTIEDLEEAISKVGTADLVGTNTAEKVIPFDTTTDKTIAGDIPISDAIEDLDNSLPVINPIPSLPEYVDGGSSTNSLFKMYHVTTSAQLPQLASILWDENLISQLQKWISNPMDYIVSLQAFPINPIDGDMEEVKIGSFATNLSMKKVANQFMTYSCGSVRVDKKFFNFLDTITTIDIYLPFIGIFPLNTTQVMGGKLSVDYQIDFLSGSCVANIRLIKDNQNVIIATNSGNLSAVLPLSSRDFSNVYGALIGTVGGAIGTAVGFASGNVAMGTASALGTLNNISGFRQGVRNSGAINGNSGLLNYKKPFLIINRPIPKIPNNYGHSVGFLDNTERYLNQVSGFSKFTNVDLSSVTLTELEKDRIKQKLEDGCIF